MKNNSVGIPERLKQLRREKGITQTELASQIGVGRAAIANWETGVRTPGNDAITALCRLFDVSPDYLCGRVDVRNLVIVPPAFHIDMTKLNYAGQQLLYSNYEFLCSRAEYTE